MAITWLYRFHWLRAVLMSCGVLSVFLLCGKPAIALTYTLASSAEATSSPSSESSATSDLSDSPSDSPSASLDLDLYDEYPDFERLLHVLEQANFVVKLELPPKRGNYGLFEIETRTIWINPVVFELGIAQHTLVHEAVHAAQLCGSHGEIGPLALGLEPPLVVQPYFMRYSGIRRLIEAEAYTVQALENSVDYVIELLNTHCD